MSRNNQQTEDWQFSPKQQLRQKKVGRPPRKFTAEEIARIEEMAFNNCHAETIAKVIGCDAHTLKKYFSSVLTQKRAEGKAALRKTQRDLAKTAPGMAIFLGKNELEQRDSKDLNLGGQKDNPINIIMFNKATCGDDSKPETHE